METNSATLKDHLGYWLRLVSNHVSAAFAAKLAACNVTVVEWVMLRELYDAAQPPSTLADRLNLTRGAVTKLADRLAARNLIRRQASATDGRAQTLELTPKGKALIPQLGALADSNDAEFFGPLSAREQAVLRQLLQKIVKDRGLRGIPTQ
ncbi:MAG: MarR family transcriptional regulator [Alphaproteobacteria bacterium]|nr:MarR family transcriptional regulator [Alphaproteobacteria bacterium]MDB5741177.1 MarR family transcriptional regulator [Alphaproteobacteria bacterium]